jgi:hypothetical protein
MLLYLALNTLKKVNYNIIIKLLSVYLNADRLILDTPELDMDKYLIKLSRIVCCIKVQLNYWSKHALKMIDYNTYTRNRLFWKFEKEDWIKPESQYKIQLNSPNR